VLQAKCKKKKKKKRTGSVANKEHNTKVTQKCMIYQKKHAFLNIMDMIRGEYLKYDVNEDKDLAKANGYTLASSTLL
jgi:hypothetical protein